MTDIYIVEMQTNKGNITLELNAKAAPITVANFIKYAQEGFYTDTIFHRVINGFMIQGGGMDANLNQKPGHATIKNEANNGLKNDIYTIAMARTNEPHSASSQFFINVGNNDFLNFKSETPSGWGYAVFGKVTAGTETVDAIKGVKTGNAGFHQDVPAEQITILSVEVK